MSYDLNFWKYKEGAETNHQTVYEALSEGQVVEGLEAIPIEDIVQRVGSVFGGQWERLSEVGWESANGAFQLSYSSQFFRVDCNGMSGDDMNKFIDIGNEFGCPLFDPQVGKRYEV